MKTILGKLSLFLASASRGPFVVISEHNFKSVMSHSSSPLSPLRTACCLPSLTILLPEIIILVTMTQLLLFDALTVTDRKICVSNKRLFYLVQLIGEVLHGNILKCEVKLTIPVDCINIIKFINF